MKYKLGDSVTIRSWENMENVYGVNELGSIKIPISFAVEMRGMCLNTYKITEICSTHYRVYYKDRLWSISPEMLLEDTPIINIFTLGTKS